MDPEPRGFDGELGNDDRLRRPGRGADWWMGEEEARGKSKGRGDEEAPGSGWRFEGTPRWMTILAMGMLSKLADPPTEDASFDGKRGEFRRDLAQDLEEIGEAITAGRGYVRYMRNKRELSNKKSANKNFYRI